MAVDIAVPRGLDTATRGISVARVAALPVRFVLAGIVAVSFALRLVAGLGHLIPLYFPDEYIYSSLARSIAESGRPLVRGGAAHFPALLAPILASPFWLFDDPVTAYVLTQTENSLAMSLAAVPAYLLARRIGLGKGFGLGCAVVAVACPDLMYASFVLADPIAYPLALTAIYLGVRVLERPTWRGQLAFLACAGLATFARVQFVFLPVAFVVASLVVERGSVRTAARRLRLTFGLMLLPVVTAVALGPSRVLGYYSGIGDLHVGGGFLHWIATDAMLLAYASGWILVPAAVVGIALAIFRPASRAEAAFGGLVGASCVGLFTEAGLYASNGSDRFQERYLFLLVPLMAPAFGLCMSRATAGRRAVPLIAVALLVLSARVPLAAYTVGDSRQDSPFLFAVYKLIAVVDAGNGALAVAAVAGVLSIAGAAAALAPRRRVTMGVALGVSIAVSAVVSAAAVSTDNRTTRAVKAELLPADVRWVDHANLGRASLLQTDGTPPERSLEQLFWNTSVRRVVLLGAAPPIDAFASERARISRDGRLLVGGRAEHGPLLVSTFATQVQLTGAVLARRGKAFSLYRPAGTPRLSVLSNGLYDDGWLAGSGRITVWQEGHGPVDGTLELRLSLPPGPGSITLQLRGPGVKRDVTLEPGTRTTVELPVHGARPWILHFHAPDAGRLPDGRQISMVAGRPEFVPARPTT